MRKDLSLETILGIVEKRKLGVTVMAIQDQYGLSYGSYRKCVSKALTSGLITDEEYKKIVMNKPKLDIKLVKRIVNDRKEGMFMVDILKKYDISKSTFQVAINRAIEMDLLTREEYLDLSKAFSSLSFEGLVKKHGKLKAKQICSKAWEAGIGNDHNRLVDAARAGGLKTQEVAPHVVENLRHAVSYGQGPKYSYKGVEFGSKGEVWLAAMLLEFGLLKKIVEGKNYQVLQGNKVIDFVVDDMAIEFHPIPKGIDSQNNYMSRREEDLRNSGFDGRLIVIEKKNDFYKSGLASSFMDYVKKCRVVDKKLEKAMKLQEELDKVPF